MFLATVNHMVDCAIGVGGKPGSRTEGSTSVEMPTTEDGTGICGMGSGEIMLNNGPEIFVTSETLVQGDTFFSYLYRRSFYEIKESRRSHFPKTYQIGTDNSFCIMF
ncbi:uncharacterized protein GVI51_L07425 [Nakaseomyces glabratus]|uniref:Uncharacterized protein n=1 Tax=Candida glabrata (strain ATCC 2001 / BCRC 20586 / JCM 3761 / NBRC 0622 / NRRL Y-65 / CBS 138) TaxID=284593 RepID=Q6FKY7_CANGA|nr:uncharacterized protein CAGL0L07568g [Nakaseomyces glabratus]KAH7581597.1 hypothetical protein J7298_04422 [Nakaseomyces glabratus]KAH7595159.1 hypothetical protein J7295_04382 [Nakaseomyces glabratus]KAH7595588.1 hypothetical protein J7294_04414 [Nakaseomyces glabratus]KAH7602020.1 hypothetical protein J7293_04407 [Nakaseomyces glabratus]KAH7611243.1 hypothetical protein J7292_04393 [Nakaseomyces glabratus]|eukprot:XP_449107.1 uncharacterized protein CAGL0L07568g [[Candida] glabrata]